MSVSYWSVRGLQGYPGRTATMTCSLSSLTISGQTFVRSSWTRYIERSWRLEQLPIIITLRKVPGKARMRAPGF